MRNPEGKFHGKHQAKGNNVHGTISNTVQLSDPRGSWNQRWIETVIVDHMQPDWAGLDICKDPFVRFLIT